MSRLIVKNLPKSVTETKLKELFSQKGLVTDVQLKYTKEGKFRRFCFIGFKTEKEALAAKEYFDKTCIDTFKIFVEQCASLGDPSKPKSWSKYASDSSQNEISDKKKQESSDYNESHDDKKNEKKKKKTNEKTESQEVKEALKKHKDDPLFIEFFESRTNKNLNQILNDDNAISINNNENNNDNNNIENSNEVNFNCQSDIEGTEEAMTEKTADKVISDLQYMEALKKKKIDIKDEESINKNVLKHGPLKLFTVKVRGLGYNYKKKHIKQFFHPLKAKSIRIPPKIKGIAYIGFKTEQHMKKALVKNKSFLGGKQLFVTKYEEKENTKETVETETNDINIKWKKQEEALKGEESIAESGKMFVRNLAYMTTEDDIKQLFEKYGPLSEVNLPIDRSTRKQKGFATVTFMMPEHAVKAYSELDGSILNGRMLHLLPAKAKFSLTEQYDQANLTFKQKKELQNKTTANSSHNWNTLFLGQNAVAETMATTYNTTKENVLGDGSKGMSAAVKLALGETQLVQDTKKFLEENGVCLDAFNQPPSKRSKTIILVKNLPNGTLIKDIRNMFAQYGELGRVVMPPSGITVLVEFLEQSEARKAFLKLAYTKFKHMPLYLEWAPNNSFVQSSDEFQFKKSKEVENDTKQTVEIQNKKTTNDNSQRNESGSDKEDEEPEPDTTIFVKNINFTTSENALKEYFSKCGAIHYVTIATKKDPKNPSSKLSMGYGFVRYKRKCDADRALKTMQMTVLDGKTLELKRSERILTSEIKTTKKTSKVTAQTGTKILVRNVPFQATLSEITELFKAFGELKAVRLPKKLMGVEKHRGFAFVEYYTKSEAKKAFNALCQSTHLYGRRLVLEWAQTEEGIDEIRKRTAKHFQEDTENVTNRSKRSTIDLEDVGLSTE